MCSLYNGRKGAKKKPPALSKVALLTYKQYPHRERLEACAFFLPVWVVCYK
jgi:hypothetical protein